MNALDNHQDSRPALELSAPAAPLFERKDHDAPSIFRPENMLREARRQKSLNSDAVPAICVIDPDGDIVTHVRRVCAASQSKSWACFHTRMWEWTANNVRCGIIGHVVGGSFSVLVAEQLFVSGCELLVNIASAGQITNIGRPPYYILIERALRDEGTSYHYLPPSAYVEADPALVELAARAFGCAGRRVHRGATELRRREGILAVEMEAAALYAFAAAWSRPVICLAHVSNRLGCVEGDFEKGKGNGASSSLELAMMLAAAWVREVLGRVAAAE
jgi:uridine phosphorylase